MTEGQAKKQLRQMLRALSPGSLLHLLSELFAEDAKRAQCAGDQTKQKRAREVASALFVVGLGVDAACPR